ncbi:MAG: hypothetical protein SF187_06650 [Deltaproteobacteria bacterium]|nr:hypothetical protein [Deltaproteobacteria bacterium]
MGTASAGTVVVGRLEVVDTLAEVEQELRHLQVVAAPHLDCSPMTVQGQQQFGSVPHSPSHLLRAGLGHAQRR